MLKESTEQTQKGLLSIDQMMARILDIKSVKDLEAKVVNSKKPVVIFCMAKWCNTSKQLLPTILERYSMEHELWDLAFLDIDVDAKLTSALKIDKVPSVMLAYQGNIIDGFKGLVAQAEIDKFF